MSRWEVIHGDALDVLRTLPTNSVNAVVTDPPYLVGAISVGNANAKSGTWADMENAAHWFAMWFALAFRLVGDRGPVWTCLSWRTLPTIIRAASLVGRSVTSVVVWDKDWIGAAGPAALRPRYEMMALMAGAEFILRDRSEPDIWRHPWSSQKPSGHPAEKPVDLMRRAIRNSSIPVHGVVLDPFCGSGTTGVACVLEGRRFLGIEREAQYVEIARRRIAEAAAQTNLFAGADGGHPVAE